MEATAQGAAFRRIAVDSLDPPRDGEVAARSADGGGSPSSATPAQESNALHHAAHGPHPRPEEDFASLLALIPDADLTYPVAAATLFATQHIALPQALTAYLHGAIANLVSAAQRLVPLGQTDGQRVLRDLRPAILAAVDAACELPDSDPFDAFVGTALMSELGCMAHETQYTRLFRT